MSGEDLEAPDLEGDQGEDAAPDLVEDEGAPDLPEEDECGPFAHEVGGFCEATLAWSDGPALPTRRDHHASLLVEGAQGAWLLVAGGARDGGVELRGDILGARLGEDGALGAWEQIGQLPEPTAGLVVSAHEGHLWIFGGIVPDGNSFTFSPRGYRCALDREAMKVDGCVELAGLETPKWHHQMFVRGEYLYDLGGVSFSDARVDEVRRAAIGADGALGAWEALPPLPVPLSHHGSARSEGSLYVVGGLTSEGYSRKVYRADFDAEGALGRWREELPLPGPRVTPAVALLGQWLFVMSGLNDSEDPQEAFLRSSVRAELVPGGGVGRWDPLEVELPLPQSHVHQVPVWGNRVYVMGGRTGEQGAQDEFLSTTQVSVGVIE